MKVSALIVNIPVSIGELIDKITILEIKKKIMGELPPIIKELDLLQKIENDLALDQNVQVLKVTLREINEELWFIEEAKRNHEKKQIFDEKFIELARNVYLKNDRRASIKGEINRICNSEIVEVKSHEIRRKAN